MKTSLNPLRIVLVLSLAAVLVTIIHRTMQPAASPVPVETAALEPAEASEVKADAGAQRVAAPFHVVATASRAAAAPEDVQAVPEGTAVEMGSDIELAYQLGEDVRTMTPEARARLRAEWEARVEAAKSGGDQIN